MRIAYTSFSVGELSPLIASRMDQQLYHNGLRTCRNFVTTIEGAIQRRGGTQYIDTLPNGDIFLAKFVFNITQSFVLVFTPNKIQFYKDGGAVLVNGAPLTLTTPFTNLYTDQQTFALSLAQQGDVIYIASENYPPYKLSRRSNTNWTLVEAPIENGPFNDLNKTETTLKLKGNISQNNFVACESSTALFLTKDVDRLIRLEQFDLDDYKPWEVDTDYKKGDLVSQGGRFYEALADGKSGTAQPIHTENTAKDGANGVNWKYLHSGFGLGKISSVQSATECTFKILKTMPSNLFTTPTPRWQLGDWSAEQGYPTHVAFFRNRLAFFGRQRLWLSVTGDYENFSPQQGDTIQDDDGITASIASDQSNAIAWISAMDRLIIGTGQGEFVCSENTNGDGLSSRNIRIAKQSNVGGRKMKPVIIGSETVFVQRGGQKVQKIGYSLEADGFRSNDLTTFASHITQNGIKDMAFMSEPSPILWAVTVDGGLIGLTYDASQQIMGWHRHDFDGNVLTLTVVPDDQGQTEQLWLVIERTIKNKKVRHLERLSIGLKVDQSIVDSTYLDSHLTYRGNPVQSVSGLNHLEGKTVHILADGKTHNPKVVKNGSVDLDVKASIVCVGLPFLSEATTMPLEINSKKALTGHDVLLANKLHITEVTFRFYRSVYAKAGPVQGPIDPIHFRTLFQVMDAATEPFTGDKALQFGGGWDNEGALTIQQDQPYPLTLLGLFAEVATDDEQE